jgi:hypothetical protein
LSAPKVLSEEETIRKALSGMSLARFGDGELRLASGRGTAVTQMGDKRLAAELCDILKNPPEHCLVCLPDFHRGPKKDNWTRYGQDYLKFYGKGPYGSAFVSRPDSAPWIDTPEYWQNVESLWAGKNVIFVAGTDRSLRDEDFASAKKFCRIEAPRRDAYIHVDMLETNIATLAEGNDAVVILCLGPTATVLAARLSRKGIHALDLGHVGMFRRHAGAYRFTLDDLASPAYRKMLEQMHQQTKGWANDGHKHSAKVKEFAEAIGAGSLLDYGCGQEALKKALGDGFKVEGFDVGIPGKAVLPKPAGLVVCTDCLEHVEKEKLDNVLRHICLLAEKGAYLVIATRPANAVLPDGKNAHLIVRNAEWWIERVSQLDIETEHSEIRGNHEVAIWLRK